VDFNQKVTLLEYFRDKYGTVRVPTKKISENLTLEATNYIDNFRYPCSFAPKVPND